MASFRLVAVRFLPTTKNSEAMLVKSLTHQYLQTIFMPFGSDTYIDCPLYNESAKYDADRERPITIPSAARAPLSGSFSHSPRFVPLRASYLVLISAHIDKNSR